MTISFSEKMNDTIEICSKRLTKRRVQLYHCTIENWKNIIKSKKKYAEILKNKLKKKYNDVKVKMIKLPQTFSIKISISVEKELKSEIFMMGLNHKTKTICLLCVGKGLTFFSNSVNKIISKALNCRFEKFCPTSVEFKWILCNLIKKKLPRNISLTYTSKIPNFEIIAQLPHRLLREFLKKISIRKNINKEDTEQIFMYIDQHLEKWFKIKFKHFWVEKMSFSDSCICVKKILYVRSESHIILDTFIKCVYKVLKSG